MLSVSLGKRQSSSPCLLLQQACGGEVQLDPIHLKEALGSLTKHNLCGPRALWSRKRTIAKIPTFAAIGARAISATPMDGFPARRIQSGESLHSSEPLRCRIFPLSSAPVSIPRHGLARPN